MADNDWRTRLDEAIRKSGKSRRAVSLEAGRGAGYVHSLLAEGKDPTVDNLMQVCEAVGASAAFILYGVDISPETEEVIRLLERNPAAREGILTILRGKGAP